VSSPTQDREGRIGYALALVALLAIWLGFGPSTGTFAVGCVAAVLAIFALSWRHDRSHRARGEAPHAIWGHYDKNKPWGRVR
jgi:hypothetical protein